jgi:predicted nucleic acid-binding protein
MKLAYIDSSIWITRVEGSANYRQILDDKLTSLLQEGWQFCVSDAILLEVLAKPYKQNHAELISIYRKIFEKVKHLKTPSDIFVNALLFIQTEQLNAMDAVHVAIALHHHCQCMVSTDKHFRDLKAIQPIWIDLLAVPCSIK